MNKEKSKFFLGLLSTVAILSLLGFIIMSAAYLKKDNNNVAANAGQAEQKGNIKPTPAPSPNPAPAPARGQAVKITVSKDDHIRGNFDAPITIVEYSDFQCPYCSRFHQTMNQVMQNYPDDVRWVFRQFPLDSIHQYARKAAEASECAAEQGKFWEYADELFTNQSSFSSDYFARAAKKLNLNTSKFDDCLSGGKYTQKVNASLSDGRQKGVSGTPGNYINGQKLGGAVPYEQLKSMIDNLLK